MRAFHASGRSSSGELAGEDLLLQLEAQDDVQVVGRLVGLDADERRLHLVDRPVEVVELDVPELRRERLLQLRIEEAPEREAAADEVLPHAALRLVEAHRGHLRERRPLERRVDAGLVEAVPELVDRWRRG